MSRFYSDGLDISQLPAPNVVEALSYEAILAEMLEDLEARFAAANIPFDTAHLETEPVAIIIQAFAYREFLIRGRVNDGARAIMLAFAAGSDLDQIGANKGVARLEGESDKDFRRRIQLSPEGYTTAGSEGSYIFHASSADPDVKGIQAVSPEPGRVTVYVLSREGSGDASPELIDAVEAALNPDEIRPLTDFVTVVSADVTTYAIEAELVMFPGPDADVIRQAAEDAVRAYAADVHQLGHDVAISGLHQALHRPGVQRVNLTLPAANLVAGEGEAYFASGITVTVAAETDV